MTQCLLVAADKLPEQRDPTKELGQYGRYAWLLHLHSGNSCQCACWLQMHRPTAAAANAHHARCQCTPQCALSSVCPAALPLCSCGEGGKYPFRMCSLKRVPDPANPPLWDGGMDWTSGAVA